MPCLSPSQAVCLPVFLCVRVFKFSCLHILLSTACQFVSQPGCLPIFLCSRIFQVSCLPLLLSTACLFVSQPGCLPSHIYFTPHPLSVLCLAIFLVHCLLISQSSCLPACRSFSVCERTRIFQFSCLPEFSFPWACLLVSLSAISLDTLLLNKYIELLQTLGTHLTHILIRFLHFSFFSSSDFDWIRMHIAHYLLTCPASNSQMHNSPTRNFHCMLWNL